MATFVYAAFIEGRAGGYGAHFPDLPGCVTAADTQAELLEAAREALTLHLKGMIEDGEAIPEATPVEALVEDPEAPSVGRMLVDADVEETPVRINVSFTPSVLRRIDAAAEQRGLTRSGFLVFAARQVMDGPQGWTVSNFEHVTAPAAPVAQNALWEGVMGGHLVPAALYQSDHIIDLNVAGAERIDADYWKSLDLKPANNLVYVCLTDTKPAGARHFYGGSTARTAAAHAASSLSQDPVTGRFERRPTKTTGKGKLA